MNSTQLLNFPEIVSDKSDLDSPSSKQSLSSTEEKKDSLSLDRSFIEKTSDSDSEITSDSEKTIYSPPPESLSDQERKFLLNSDRSSIEETNEGKYKSTRKPNPIEILTFSGGGARGVTYVGVVQALEEAGYLSTIQSINAASVGAIFGSLIASGMAPQELKDLLDKTDLLDLLSKSEVPKNSPTDDKERENSSIDNKKSENPSTENENPEKTQRSLIKTLAANAGTTAPRLKQLINDEMCKVIRKNINKKIDKGNFNIDDPNNYKIKYIYEKLGSNESITFKDLETLNKYFPEIKKFNCTTTVTFGSDKPQSALLNATTTPDLPISEAVCASAALPFIFSEIKLKNENFDIDKNAKYADGGLLINTPVPALMHGIGDISKNLVFVFEGSAADQAANDKIPNSGNIIQSLIENIIGAPYITAGKYEFKELYQHAPSENIIVIPSRNIGENKEDYSGLRGMLAFDISQENKNSWQDKAYEETLRKLKERENQEKEIIFETFEKLVYSLNDDEFNDLKSQAEDNKNFLSEEEKKIIHQRNSISNKLNGFLNSMGNILQEKANKKEKEDRAKKTEEIIKLAQSNKIKSLMQNKSEIVKEFITNKIAENYFEGLSKINDYRNFEELSKDRDSERNTNSKDSKNNTDLEKINNYLIIEKTIDLLRKNSTLTHHLPIFNIISNKIDEIHIKNISNRIIQDLIYPEKNIPWQPNMDSLLNAEKNLNKAKTKEDINNAIDTLIKEYKSPLPKITLYPQIKTEPSNFLEKAQTYKLKVPTTTPAQSPDNSKKSMKRSPSRR